jgi:choline dehydrogenase-like flavoprotein
MPENLWTRDDLAADQELDCDVLVIGSGAGGATTAAELAEGGLDVIVLEEGSYVPTEEFTTDTAEMVRKLYRDGGASLAFGTPVVTFAEGRCVGGSTVINGGMSWRTPEKILDRWSREDQVAKILPGDLDRYFARVEKFVSARGQDAGTVGRDNQLLKAGADRMGWKTVENVRNQHHCVGANRCAFGCPTKAKRSMLVSYLPRALAFGARLYADCGVTRLTTVGKRITGAEARVVLANGSHGAKITVRARQGVVVSCGAIHTPALLARSGVKSPSRAIGQHLTLHPNAKVIAVFDEEVTGWQGTHQAYQVREFQEQGFLMAAVNAPPGLLAMGTKRYGNPLDEIMSDYGKLVTGGILVEDTVFGQVRTILGRPQAFYQMSDFDGERLVRGIALLSELLFAAGARRVVLPFDEVPDLLSADDARALFARKIPKRALEVMTVHMMGTARMGGDRTRHVCDSWGKVYDAEGLWIADASLFPSPIGVNPMETIMALATRNAERMLESVEHPSRKPSRRAA